MAKAKYTILLLILFPAAAISASAAAQENRRPLMKDFMGLCVHTVMFKPELYQPACRLVRDYHGIEWDLGKDTDFWPTFPFARNKVNWEAMYSQWTEAGFEINASLMFASFESDDWVNPKRDAHTYGFAFARFFGPANRNLVTSCEIGNEPGEYSDDEYRTIFENMARGIRQGDPAMKIVTCAATAGKSGKYAKSLSCVKGLEELYDVINVHSYAEVQGWPTWQRSFPEDETIAYLKNIQAVIDWRDKNAPGKEVWLTEFGWDSSTKNPSDTGTFKDWIGSNDIEQANYLVRSWLIFSAMDIDRAYMYWFNDEDKPQVHGSSGLTRNYQPKPSYYAMSHLFATLGEYRFSRTIEKTPAERYIFEFTHESNPAKRIIAAWVPTGDGKPVNADIEIGNGKISKVEQTPLTKSPVTVKYRQTGQSTINVPIGRSPVYIWIEN